MQKTLVMVTGLQAEIWTQNLVNMKQECQLLHHDVQS
jgi:hypothetical protein